MCGFEEGKLFWKEVFARRKECDEKGCVYHGSTDPDLDYCINGCLRTADSLAVDLKAKG